MTGRRKKSSPLPARVYEKHGTWWFVDINRKWHKLCRVSEGLMRLYAQLSQFNREADERAATDNMPALVDDWLVVKLREVRALDARGIPTHGDVYQIRV
jgi:hypothetical protein